MRQNVESCFADPFPLKYGINRWYLSNTHNMTVNTKQWFLCWPFWICHMRQKSGKAWNLCICLQAASMESGCAKRSGWGQLCLKIPHGSNLIFPDLSLHAQVGQCSLMDTISFLESEREFWPYSSSYLEENEYLSFQGMNMKVRYMYKRNPHAIYG